MAQVYHIRTINGTAAPMVKSLTMVESVIDLDSTRSASGLLNRNVIGKKHKFTLEFSPMTKTELQALLTQLNADSFTVTYENLITSVVDSGTFYHNDFEVKPYWIKSEDNTNVLYDTFSINLIEY